MYTLKFNSPILPYAKFPLTQNKYIQDFLRTYEEDKDQIERGLTHYQVIAGPGTLFERGKVITKDQIKPPVSRQILIIEAARPVPWTKPEDVTFTSVDQLPPLGVFDSHVSAALLEGSVQLWTHPVSRAEWHSAILSGQ